MGPHEPIRTAEDAELDAMLVHDLRSPIAAIAANFAFLRHALAKGDPMLLESVADGEIATLTLRHLVENMALLSLLESGAAPVGPQEVSLAPTVKACVDRLAPIAASAEVGLEIGSACCDAGPCVRATPALVQSVLDNLVHAALRHTPRSVAVGLRVSLDGGFGVVEVTDGGGPVPEDLASVLFTREGQRRAKREADSRYGRGLGLLVAGLAARADEGRLEVTASGGTNVFRVAWPISGPQNGTS